MHTILFGILCLLVVSLSIFVLLAAGEMFKANSCAHYLNPWCYSDWTCSAEQGGMPADGTDKPAIKLQNIVLMCSQLGQTGDPNFDMCPDLWSSPPLIQSATPP